MSNDKEDNDKNVIHFPRRDSRKAVEKQLRSSKRSEEKEQKSTDKGRARLEEEYRRQYKAEQAARAKLRSRMAQNSARSGGKVPFVNWDKIPLFVRLSVGAFILIHIMVSVLIPESERLGLFMNYGFVPAAYFEDVPGSNILTLMIAPFTSLFLHGGWMHLTFNVVMMLAIGIFFERTFGTKRTVIFFILCGLCGHVMYFALNPHSFVPVIGASGAISGIFGVTMIAMGENGLMGSDVQKRGPVPFILLWTTLIVVTGFLSHDMAWQSHLGGFWGGLGLHYLSKRGILKI